MNLSAESTAVPPKIKTAAVPSLAVFAGLVFGLAAGGVAAVVFFFNPSQHSFYPVCQFHQLTGLNCPGCGATRALYALLHGNFSTALRDNAFFVLVLAAAGGRGIWFGAKKLLRRPAGEFLPLNFFWPLLFAALVFAVLRNLPAFAFLSPA